MTELSAELSARLQAADQAHLLEHWADLDAMSRARLAKDLQSVDFPLLEEWRSLIQKPSGANARHLAPLSAIAEGEEPEEDTEAARIGEGLLKAGKVAAFTVAGGQGTRLGHPGPKGTFPVSPVLKKPLFQIFAERIAALGRRYGRPIPWYIMTSPANHEETLAFFKDHARFGLDDDDVRFFSQGMVPALDQGGRLVLDQPDRLFKSPDGHGGSLRALHISGALSELRARGVEDIFYFQVDNPLVRICDPVFLGYHHQAGSDFSSKAVPKRDPSEKVGVLVQADGAPTVIEYSDLPEDLREARDDDGRLSYRAGNVAIHIIRRAFVEELNRDRFSLPWHVARKKLPRWSPGAGVQEIEGFKFETFVFDALPLAARTMVLEIARQDDFSPVKNSEGVDSPQTSERDQSERFAGWLERAGIRVPRDAAGALTVRLEIAPSFALDEAELKGRLAEIPNPITGDLALGS